MEKPYRKVSLISLRFCCEGFGGDFGDCLRRRRLPACLETSGGSGSGRPGKTSGGSGSGRGKPSGGSGSEIPNIFKNLPEGFEDGFEIPSWTPGACLDILKLAPRRPRA